MSEEHPKFPGFQEVGHLDVDAGSIWLGDGCYVLKDKDEERPKDLGDDWHGICRRFFKRSGYDARSREWSAWSSRQDRYLHEHADWKAWMSTLPPREEGVTPAHHKHGTPEYQAKHELMDRIYEEFAAANPFTPIAVDTGVAQFNHDAGHSGMGLMVSTYYGDGSYPVYVEYKDGRPRRVLIDFDPGADEEEEELLEAAE